ncbi:MAG TPA: CoA-binding protein [Candidatus Limnocylindria bacterium]|jgi:predicted CoA-binding protein|nr:CoA-binding protein [Candidatus Limnocylindria bacterium]
MGPTELLRQARTILLIDWPSRDVPDTLARAGYAVVAADGPAPDDYAAYEWNGVAVVTRRVGAPPDHAELVYSHRPLAELPRIIALARQVGAKAIWCQTGSVEARSVVESAGLEYVDAPTITEAVRILGSRR